MATLAGQNPVLNEAGNSPRNFGCLGSGFCARRILGAQPRRPRGFLGVDGKRSRTSMAIQMESENPVFVLPTKSTRSRPPFSSNLLLLAERNTGQNGFQFRSQNKGMS